MQNRLIIAMLVYMMVQAVLFGVGLLVILAIPVTRDAMSAMVWMIAITAAISVPISLMIAPRLTARYWHGRHGDVISG